MTYVLTIISIDDSEKEIHLGTSNTEEAISIAEQYAKDGEGIYEYLYLSKDTIQLEYSYSSGVFEYGDIK